MQFVASLYRLLLRLGRFLLVAPFLTGWLLVWIGLGVIISTFVSTILIFGIRARATSRAMSPRSPATSQRATL